MAYFLVWCEVFLFLNFLPLLVFSQRRFSCMDDGGNTNVDWFIVLKYPKIKQSRNKMIADGVGYAYMDSNRNAFVTGGHSIADRQSAVGATLQTYYSGRQIRRQNNFAHFMYNDQPPNHRNRNQNNKPGRATQGKRHGIQGQYAHAKGVVVFDNNSGFWLIHSVPEFPDASAAGYDFPGTVQKPSGRRYGQIFMCVTFKSKEINDIAGPLALMKAKIYDQNIPPNWNLPRDLPNVDKLLNKQIPVNPQYAPGLISLKVTSNGGTTFKQFVKRPSKTPGPNHFDIHEEIAKKFDNKVISETWRLGSGGPLGDTKKVANANFVNLLNTKYSYKKDHSKYLVEEKGSSNKDRVCIGDVNRMRSQSRRGGGFLCLKDRTVWQKFRDILS